MDRSQAAEIRGHLLKAASAIDRASEAIFALGQGDLRKWRHSEVRLKQ
jgi:hypothetical protein